MMGMIKSERPATGLNTRQNAPKLTENAHNSPKSPIFHYETPQTHEIWMNQNPQRQKYSLRYEPADSREYPTRETLRRRVYSYEARD